MIFSIISKRYEVKDLDKIIFTGINLLNDGNEKLSISFNIFFQNLWERISVNSEKYTDYYQKLFYQIENAKYDLKMNSMNTLIMISSNCSPELQEELLRLGQLNENASFLSISIPIQLLTKIFISTISIIQYLQNTLQIDKYIGVLNFIYNEIDQQKFTKHPHFDIRSTSLSLISLLNNISSKT